MFTCMGTVLLFSPLQEKTHTLITYGVPILFRTAPKRHTLVAFYCYSLGTNRRKSEQSQLERIPEGIKELLWICCRFKLFFANIAYVLSQNKFNQSQLWRDTFWRRPVLWLSKLWITKLTLYLVSHSGKLEIPLEGGQDVKLGSGRRPTLSSFLIMEYLLRHHSKTPSLVGPVAIDRRNFLNGFRTKMRRQWRRAIPYLSVVWILWFQWIYLQWIIGPSKKWKLRQMWVLLRLVAQPQQALIFPCFLIAFYFCLHCKQAQTCSTTTCFQRQQAPGNGLATSFTRPFKGRPEEKQIGYWYDCSIVKQLFLGQGSLWRNLALVSTYAASVVAWSSRFLNL